MSCRPRSPVTAGLELESAAPPVDLERRSPFRASPDPRLHLLLTDVTASVHTCNSKEAEGGDSSATVAEPIASVAKPARLLSQPDLALSDEGVALGNGSIQGGPKSSSMALGGVPASPGTADELSLQAGSMAGGVDGKLSRHLMEPQEQQELPREGEGPDTVVVSIRYTIMQSHELLQQPYAEDR